MTHADNTRWLDRIVASFIFFTRLPFYRLRQPDKACYQTVVEHWPLTGWLTGGVMAATLWAGSMVLPGSVAVVMAIAMRLLVTGALHEDGLADFLDGFGGGGGDRQRTLDIMKDSHIGTYGTVGLILYFLVLYTALSSMPAPTAALCILAADPYAKMVSSQLVMMLPYARSEGQAKARVVYRRPTLAAGIGLAVQGLLPMACVLWLTQMSWQMVVLVPCVLMYFLYMLIRSRLRGYTGDCCGAVCLLVELSVYVVACAG